MPNGLKPKNFILFHTEGCHLCELAAQLLCDAKASFVFQDICDDEKLADKYGTSIPVIKALKTNEELKWPFDYQILIDFMGANIESSSN